MRCNNRGFTIVEIMIAASIFATISMLTITIVVGLSRQYQKGTYSVQLNDASRTVHQDLRDGISYGGSITIDPSMNDDETDYFCAGREMYHWRISKGGTIYNGLYLKQLTPGQLCDLATAKTDPKGTNMLPSDGFVTLFSITPQNDIYNITTNFALGTADMFKDNTFTQCLDTLRGGDFCAIINYNSSVKSRL